MLLTNTSIFIHSFVHSLVCFFVCPFFPSCVASSVLLIVALFALSHSFHCLFLCLSSRAWMRKSRLTMGPFPLEALVRAPSCRPLPQTNVTEEEKHTNLRTSVARSGSLRTKNDSSGCSGPRKTPHKII